MSTKAQLIDEVMYLDALAAQITARSKQRRAELEEIARAEYEIEGVAPSWRHPNGTVPLALSSARYDVTDRKAWIDWIAERYPMEIEEIIQVRPAFEKSLLESFAKQGEDACTDDGEIPPGVTFTPGGTPRGISIRYAKGVREQLAELAQFQLDLMTTPQKGTETL